MARAQMLYAIGVAGVLAAVVGELAGPGALAGVGYLIAVVGLFGGFLADRRKPE